MDHNRALQTVKIFKHWWSGIFTGQSNACRTLSKHWRQEIFVGKRNQHTIRYFSDTRGEHQAGQRMPLLCYAHMYAHMHKQTTPKQCLQSDLQDGNRTHLMAHYTGQSVLPGISSSVYCDSWLLCAIQILLLAYILKNWKISVGAKSYSLHDLADLNQHIWNRDKTLEFSITGQRQAGQRMPLPCYAHTYAHMHKKTMPPVPSRRWKTKPTTCLTAIIIHVNLP